MREISAGIIIYRKTIEGLKFLILYHGRGYWNFPKGRIENEERSLQAAFREVEEETGILKNDIKLIQHFKTYEKFTFWRSANRGIHNVQRGAKTRNPSEKIFKIVIFYLAETKKATVKISNKHEEGYCWFTYKEAMKILSKYKDSQRLLTQVNNFLQKSNR